MKVNKLIVFFAWAAAFTEMLTINAYAYIDPSATTYMIQVIAGIVVAIGATGGVIISKLKKKAKEKLNVDLNKNKEVEEDIVEFDDKD